MARSKDQNSEVAEGVGRCEQKKQQPEPEKQENLLDDDVRTKNTKEVPTQILEYSH